MTRAENLPRPNDPAVQSVGAGPPSDGPAAGHPPDGASASLSSALVAALKPLAATGSSSSSPALNAATWGAIRSLETIVGGSTSRSPLPSTATPNSAGPPLSPGSPTSALATASLWGGLAALLAGDPARNLDPRGAATGDPHALTGALATASHTPSGATDAAGRLFETSAGVGSRGPGQDLARPESASLVHSSGRDVWPWHDLMNPGPPSSSGSSGSTPAAPNLGDRTSARVGVEGLPGIAAAVLAGANSGSSGTWSGAPAAVAPSVRLPAHEQIMAGLGVVGGEGPTSAGLGLGNSESAPPGSSYFISGVSHPGLDAGAGAFGPSIDGSGVSGVAGVYPGMDGAGALAAGLAPAAALGGLTPAPSADPGAGPALDLAKTNELLQQLLDEARKGRQPFLPMNDRNTAFNSYS